MKLDFGGGDGYKPEGFEAVDITGKGHRHDMSVFPYPFGDCSVEVIHCSHTLEHLSKQNAKDAIGEFYRILVPGGVLTLAVPDMDWFIDRHLSGDWAGVPETLKRDLNLCMGDDTPKNEYWRHRYMWCWESLAYCLQEVGFVEIERHGHDDSRHRHFWSKGAYNKDYIYCSLYVDAVKPR